MKAIKNANGINNTSSAFLKMISVYLFSVVTVSNLKGGTIRLIEFS